MVLSAFDLSLARTSIFVAFLGYAIMGVPASTSRNLIGGTAVVSFAAGASPALQSLGLALCSPRDAGRFLGALSVCTSVSMMVIGVPFFGGVYYYVRIFPLVRSVRQLIESRMADGGLVPGGDLLGGVLLVRSCIGSSSCDHIGWGETSGGICVVEGQSRRRLALLCYWVAKGLVHIACCKVVPDASLNCARNSLSGL